MPDIKQREFIYQIPEEFKDVDGAKELIDAVINQNTEFISNGFQGFISPEDVKTMVTKGVTETITQQNLENEKLETKKSERQKLIISKLPKTIIKGRESALIKIADILEDDSETTIDSKITKAVNENTFFVQDDFLTDFESKKEKPKQKVKKRLFTSNR